MRKYGYFSVAAGILLVGLPVALSSNASLNPIQNYTSQARFGEKLILGGECWGRSDYPHISTHVPRTVNVIAETVCPGGRVSVRTTLSRHGWLFFRQTASDSKTGNGSVRVNVAMNCKWISGEPLVEYVVESVHRDDTGASGVTRLHRFLKC